MKRCLLLVAVITLIPLAVQAQDTAAKPFKIATVNFDKVFGETEIGKAAQARIRQFVQAKDNELQQEYQKWQADVTQLDSQRSVLDQSTITQRESELQKRQIDLEAKRKDSQNTLNQMRREELDKFFKASNPIIQQIGLEQGYTLILNHPSQTSPVIYFDQSIDITDLVISRINASSTQGS